MVSYATGNNLLTCESWTIFIVSNVPEYVRVFFFPRLLIISSSFFLDYFLVLVSRTNVIFGRDEEGTSSYL